MESQGGLQGTRPAAAAVLGISPAAELSLRRSQMHTSNRSACHPCSARVSATSRTAVYGPVRTVVWEGRSREAPPYPDQCPGDFVGIRRPMEVVVLNCRVTDNAASSRPPRAAWPLLPYTP